MHGNYIHACVVLLIAKSANSKYLFVHCMVLWMLPRALYDIVFYCRGTNGDD